MTRSCHRCKSVEPAGAGPSALALPSPSCTQWDFGRVSGAPIDSAEAFDLRHAVTISVKVRLCYRLQCFGGVIWETAVNCYRPGWPMTAITTFLVTAVVLTVVGCASPYDFPYPLITPSGKKGFGMAGYVQFTSSEEKARTEITEKLEEACGGSVQLLRLDMKRADSMVGVSHIHYDVVAECE